jgi:hypothetical protein
MSAPSDATALLAWMDDAHAAIELGHLLSPSMCLALLATPTHAAARPFDATTLPRTWFLEEYEDRMRTQLRDPVPFGGTDEQITRWREQQARTSDDLGELLHQHTQCVEAARAFVAGRPAVARRSPLAARSSAKQGKPRPRRETATEQALRIAGEAA